MIHLAAFLIVIVLLPIALIMWWPVLEAIMPFVLKTVGILLGLFLLCFAYIELTDKPATDRYNSRHCTSYEQECIDGKYKYGVKMTVDQTSNLLNAYHNGKMNDDEKAQFEDDVYSGLVVLSGSGASFPPYTIPARAANTGGNSSDPAHR